MYAITATQVHRDPDTGSLTMRQVPAFYLCESTQGIQSEEHAERIAHDILDRPHHTTHVTAVKL